jgi:hypothetical protein
MVDVNCLGENERLTYWIGDIIRSDAFAEHEARVAWHELAQSSPCAGEEAPQNFAQILDGCRDMLRSVELELADRALCREVLAAAGAAHKLRNLLTHDQWMHYQSADDSWHSVKAMFNTKNLGSERPLRDFQKRSADLIRAGWRLRALGLLIPGILGRNTWIDGLEGVYKRDWRLIAEEEFEVGQHTVRAGLARKPPEVARRV